VFCAIASRSFQLKVDDVVLAGFDFEPQSRLLGVAVASGQRPTRLRFTEGRDGDAMPARDGPRPVFATKDIATIGLNLSVRQGSVIAAHGIWREDVDPSPQRNSLVGNFAVYRSEPGGLCFAAGHA